MTDPASYFAQVRPALVRYLVRRGVSVDDAEDVAGEVAVYVLRNLQPHEGLVWRHLVQTAWSRVQAVRGRLVLSLDESSFDDEGHSLLDTLADPGAGPEAEMLAAEGLEQVRAALAEADPRDRLVLTQLAAGESQARVAARLGVNRARVGQLAARARRRLAASLATR